MGIFEIESHIGQFDELANRAFIDKSEQSLKYLERAQKIFNPSEVSANIRLKWLKEEEEIQERAKNRLENYNGKPNEVVTNDNQIVIYKEKERPINWTTEKFIDSTLRELLAIKMNLMKESIESLGIEFQETTQYNEQFLKYDNWMLPGIAEGEPAHETIDTALVLLCAGVMDADFPITPEFVEYIKNAISQGLVYEKRMSWLIENEKKLEDGKNFVQAMVDSGMSSYVSLAVAGALYIESGWSAVKCPEQTEFTGLIAHKMYQTNSNGHNWGDAGEGLFGLTFWNAKERIINDPDFTPLKEKYQIPSTFQEYNKDLAAGEVDTMYVTQWKGNPVKASGHLSNLELEEWSIPLKIFLKHSLFWKDVFESTPEREQLIANGDTNYLNACLAASYLFKAGGNEATFAYAAKRASQYVAQHKSMHYAHIQDGLASQIVVSLILSRYIKGTPVKSFDELKQIIFSM